MPGIVGIISSKPLETSRRSVDAMLQSMTHEPFYQSGRHDVPELGLCCGWVAQAGSFAANQIFQNETSDVQLVFAGECYLDADARSRLVQKGHQVGAKAGDWLVHLYEEAGEAFFGQLNGLFSGVLIDRRLRRVYVFNDRYGIERLYWHESDGDIHFASEAKALLRVLPELRSFDDEGVAQFLAYGCTQDGRTLFRGLQLTPGGTLWTIENKQCRRGHYFTPAEWEALPALNADEFQKRLTDTFKRILPNYFSAEQRVGISLTGGLDTRMIMACLPPQPVAPVCYTFAGANLRMLDAQVAGRVARACGLRHELLRIGPDFFSGFGELADRTVFATDGCFGVLGAHEIYLNAKARQLSPVRITGNFGSEVLRSVSTFKPLGLSPELFDTDFSRVATSCGSRHVNGEHPVRFAAFKEIPWNLFGSLAAGRSQVNFRTPYLDNALVALAFQAPPEVRTSAASAVRFINETSPTLAAIPTDRGEGGNVSAVRRRLRRTYAEVTFKLDYHCSEGLPFGLAAMDPFYQWCNARLGIQGLHKFLTYRNWLQKELAGFAAERLVAAADAGLPFINPGAVSRLPGEHATGRKNFTREINAVLTLEAVQRLLLRSSGAS